jgi:gliding motility-associated-like protein
VEQIFGCEVTPNPFTPNYDGINDIAIFEYPKMYDRAIGASDVYIYDMYGAEVRHILIKGLTDSRRYEDRAWDGLDNDGNAPPPGVYMWIVIMQKTEEVLCSGTITLAR